MNGVVFVFACVFFCRFGADAEVEDCWWRGQRTWTLMERVLRVDLGVTCVFNVLWCVLCCVVFFSL